MIDSFRGPGVEDLIVLLEAHGPPEALEWARTRLAQLRT
jgi:hypothetical protein